MFVEFIVLLYGHFYLMSLFFYGGEIFYAEIKYT